MTNRSSESDLHSFLKLLWRQRTVVLATTLATLAIILVLDLLVRDSQYESTAEILITGSPSDLVSGQGADDLDRVMRNELVIAESSVVRAAVEETYGRDPNVRIEITEGQDVLEVIAVDSDPDRAAQLAADYSSSYLEARESAATDEFVRVSEVIRDQIEELDSQLEELPNAASDERSVLESQRALLLQRLNDLTLNSDLTENGSARIISEPFAEDSPVSPSPLRDAVLAIALGIMMGTGLAYLRELVDKIGAYDDSLIVDAIDPLPVLVELPRVKHEPALAILDDRSASLNEAFRRLATLVSFVLQTSKTQVVQVVSPVAGEGKTTVAANLALALAERRKRVLLIDGDLRSPELSSLFGIEPDKAPGLADLVLEEPNRRLLSIGDLVHKRSELLSVLPAGLRRGEAIVGLGNDRLEPLYRDFAADFEYVIVDSSPLLSVTDGALLARHADLRLLVAGTHSTRDDVLNTRALLDHLHLELGGVVLNRRVDERQRFYGSSGQPTTTVNQPAPPNHGGSSNGTTPPGERAAAGENAGTNGSRDRRTEEVARGGQSTTVDAIAHLLDELVPAFSDEEKTWQPPTGGPTSFPKPADVTAELPRIRRTAPTDDALVDEDEDPKDGKFGRQSLRRPPKS